MLLPIKLAIGVLAVAGGAAAVRWGVKKATENKAHKPIRPVIRVQPKDLGDFDVEFNVSGQQPQGATS